MHPLQNLTILLVEDTWQIRNLLTSILAQRGIGRVIRASNGAEAIQMMKLMREDPRKAGFSNIDIILSDWVMEPVDGPMLLRWVRRHKESPDRFMPFVMISAYSDDARVEMARDLGVNEFLSKPFSVRDVARHLEAVVRDTREFCRTSMYFGPNRRRKRLAPDLPKCKVIAKIESRLGIAHMAEILRAADGIMVARGDLGISVPIHEIPILQKWIIAACNHRKKPAITATQMLEHMTDHPTPTRAEVSDVANAVIDGSDFVMLSGETAAGRFPVAAVKMMRTIIEHTERHAPFRGVRRAR